MTTNTNEQLVEPQADEAKADEQAQAVSGGDVVAQPNGNHEPYKTPPN
jgi:hypothetical protein